MINFHTKMPRYCNLNVPVKDRKTRFRTYWWSIFLDLRRQFWFVGAIPKYLITLPDFPRNI
jgi:hypothetical protein